jgi:SAM-dependent methyltransferase
VFGLRSLRSRVLARNSVEAEADVFPSPEPERYDSWLEHHFGGLLGEIEARAAGQDADIFSLFNPIEDDDLWAVLLSKRYRCFPAIRRLLPDLPDPEQQELISGQSGLALSRQTIDFCAHLKSVQRRHGRGALRDCRMLDFGCGWGRIPRFLAKDIPAERMSGCDDNRDRIDLCKRLGIPGSFEVSATVPAQLPVEGPFDLVSAFSVFTHTEEETHLACLRAIHAVMAPGGLAVLTVRPPEYMLTEPAFRWLRAELGGAEKIGFDDAEYHFAPMPFPPVDGKLRYGNTVITRGYMERNWTEMFEILEAQLMLDDPYQVPIVLRKRS